MSFMEQLKKAVKKRIDSEEITVTGLAEGAECSRQMIYNFLEGKNISVKLAERIADICKLKLKVVAK